MPWRIALHYLYYNFCRIHQSLRITPAMAAGVTDHLYNLGWIVEQVARQRPKPNRPNYVSQDVQNRPLPNGGSQDSELPKLRILHDQQLIARNRRRFQPANRDVLTTLRR